MCNLARTGFLKLKWHSESYYLDSKIPYITLTTTLID